MNGLEEEPEGLRFPDSPLKTQVLMWTLQQLEESIITIVGDSTALWDLWLAFSDKEVPAKTMGLKDMADIIDGQAFWL